MRTLGRCGTCYHAYWQPPGCTRIHFPLPYKDRIAWILELPDEHQRYRLLKSMNYQYHLIAKICRVKRQRVRDVMSAGYSIPKRVWKHLG